jgi:hypothetical protein
VSVPLVLVHPFFGGKDYGRLAILGEFQLSSLCTMFASLVYRCDWVYDAVDENRDTMRKEEGGFCLKKMENLDMNQWHTGGSGSDGRYYLGLVCVKATYSYIQVQHLFEIR